MTPSENDGREIKGLYILAFTPSALEPDDLRALSQVAVEILKAKDVTFARLFEATLHTSTSIEIADIELPLRWRSTQSRGRFLLWLLRRVVSLLAHPK